MCDGAGLLRNCLSYVSYKQRKEVAADLKFIYGVPTPEAAELAPVESGEKWDERHPIISKTLLVH